MNRRTPVLPERQSVRAPWAVTEIRGADDRASTSLVDVVGVASVYDYDYEVYGGPINYGWVESVARGTFVDALADGPDVVLLINHEGMPLARTRSGTLTLSAASTGLGVAATLDRRDTEASNLLVRLERGDVDEMSFAFRVTSQTWEAHADYPDDEMSRRTITGVNLHRSDVSAVTFGASDATGIDIARSLQLASVAELEAYRALISERLTLSSTGGMPEGATHGGMPWHVAQLTIPTQRKT